MLVNGPNDIWMARVRPLGAFDCDAAFHIADALHAGPESGLSQRKRKAARVRLKSPDLPQRRWGIATTLDLIGREAALVAFYERLIATAERNGQRRALAEPFPYFRVTPALLEADEPVLAFSRTDDVRQTRAVLTALAGARADGVIWQDFGQNWFIKIVRRHGALFIVEGDIEDDERFVALRADANALSAQAGAALTRLDALHHHLTQAFGRDFWTLAG